MAVATVVVTAVVGIPPPTPRKRGIAVETKPLPAFPFAVTAITGKTFRRRQVAISAV